MWLISCKLAHLTPISMGFSPLLKSLEDQRWVRGSGKHFAALVGWGVGSPKRCACMALALLGSGGLSEEQGG